MSDSYDTRWIDSSSDSFIHSRVSPFPFLTRLIKEIILKLQQHNYIIERRDGREISNNSWVTPWLITYSMTNRDPFAYFHVPCFLLIDNDIFKQTRFRLLPLVNYNSSTQRDPPSTVHHHEIISVCTKVRYQAQSEHAMRIAKRKKGEQNCMSSTLLRSLGIWEFPYVCDQFVSGLIVGRS